MENISSNNNNTSTVISNRQSLASMSTAGNHYYPPGYRFMPTDKELIIGYLRKKVNNEPIPLVGISEVNRYRFTPSISQNYPPLGNKEWYFFTPRDRRYPNGTRPKRSVEGGVGWWKATGGDKLIWSNGKLVGKKKVLVFYFGKNKSGEEKTNWIMHEYKLDTHSATTSSNNTRLDDWVLCRIYERNNNKRKDVDDHLAPDDVDKSNNNLLVPQPTHEEDNNIEYVQPFQIQNNNINADIDQNHNHYHQRQYGGNLHQPSYDYPTLYDHRQQYFSNEAEWQGFLMEDFQQAA